MKKKLIVFVVALCALISSSAIAQVKVAIGIKAGPNFSTVNASDAGATYKSRTGWHGGGFVLFKLSKIGIQPEVLFSQQGANVHYSTGQKSVDFNYVNIPIIVKLYTVLGINLQVGPQFGFLSNSPTVRDPQGQTIDNAYKKSDVSAALGVGWDLPLGITLDARYNLGLTKINNDAALSTAKNQVWQVSVGYKLIKFGK